MIKKNIFYILILFCFLFANQVFSAISPCRELIMSTPVGVDESGDIEYVNVDYGKVCEEEKNATAEEISKSESLNLVSENKTEGYQPLTDFGSILQEGTKEQGGGLQGMLLGIYQFGLSIAGLLAIIYIVVGGVQYMTTDSIFNKEEGKNKITSAVAGLIIVLVGWTILNQINPDILKTKNETPPEIKKIDITQENRGNINLQSQPAQNTNQTQQPK